METVRQIQERFNRVIAFSQTGIPEPKTDLLFERWLEAKRDFIEAFGGKYIYEYPEQVVFELSQEEKSDRATSFIETLYEQGFSVNVLNFLKENIDGFFDNKVVVPNPTYHINKGMKLVKSLKNFDMDPVVLEEVQQAMAMIIQENKIAGTLCLSVHPLDYLSASENNHNWRSCHALNGDYRAGNLSYMVDNSTIICYLKTSDNEILPRFPKEVPWNSKKWRLWLHFSWYWDIVFAGRQYPFDSASGMEIIKDKLLPAAGIGHYDEWIDGNVSGAIETPDGKSLRLRDDYVYINGYLRKKKDVITNGRGALQFNDLLSSTVYMPLWAHKIEDADDFFWPIGWNKHRKDNSFVQIGKEVRCLRCGKDNVELSGTMMCPECEILYGDCDDDSIEICPHCGERFYYDDGVYIESLDEVVCRSCAENDFDKCECCGKLILPENLLYDKANDRMICEDCFEDIKEEKYWTRREL